ncbi:hypothetical protein N7466_001491 [Penicillium verhagenii]|uniref:uncharacterized protein n=1 Tax=Penicillium verhagenii TaxID=1562060 RepID=UPI0025459B8F|nr:uncharacterized protein N7466_001491 [Penicillium verhagenii]KAJ5938357.1 hypothetical protein N7466_001491 [Penicillium verhagenii]
MLCVSRKKLFFHSVEAANAIRVCSGKKPTPLPKTFWQLLRSATPIRTIEEEQQQRFKDAAICALPDTTFAKTIDRAFRACLALLNAPRGMQVLYVEDLAGRRDVFYHAADQTLRIPHRWWKLDSVDPGAPCHNAVPMANDGQNAPISWQEVVEELLILSISSVWTAFPMSRIIENRYMRHIRRLLQGVPQNIQISPHATGLLVTWEDPPADAMQSHEGEPGYKVVLHAGDCGADAELLHSETGRSTPPIMCGQTEPPAAISSAACGCRQQLVSRSTQWCVFAEVDQYTAYYAMLCVNEPSAIYSLPSETLIPGTTIHDSSLASCDLTMLAPVIVKHEEPAAPAHQSDTLYLESCKRLKVSHLLN